ncbi:MAG: glucose-1-phosphate cytidylyltransferase [Candidatus Sericytochromatia bacterium]
MKVVLLAGGAGTRLSEETSLRPKPMVEIGGKPILWHIMKIYSSHGFNDFIICLGYKGYMIKEYFINYFYHQCDLTIDLKENKTTVHSSKSEPWTITLVDTGLETLTGGRIKRIEPYINNETFMLTYGDGVSDVNLKELYEFHKKHNKYATLTSVQPSGRFGALALDDNDNVTAFQEKPKGDGSWINGGFFVLEPDIFKYLKDDSTIWERDPLENIAKEGQLAAYKHKGFWKPMDTLRDKIELEEMWNNKSAKWKLWD